MHPKFARGSLQLILLVILGLTAVFSVAAFAARENPVERPITIVVCQLRPNDIACVSHPTPLPINRTITAPQLPPLP